MKKKSSNGNIFDIAKRFSDALFDGLKESATNKAISAAKKNNNIQPKIVQKMSDIERASKELDQMLKDIE